MRMFLYYSLHSVWNQIRKLMKTWVLILILVCGLVGGLVGLGAATLEEAASPETEVIEDIAEEEITAEIDLNVDTLQLTELISGGVILAVFAFSALSAEKSGSKIFLPADVNLLFSSPLRPQSVLMFRLGTQLGMAVFGSLYLLFQIPNLTMNLGLPLAGVLAIMAAWVMTLVIGKLIQILVYVLCSSDPGLRKKIPYGVYGFLALILAVFIIWQRTQSAGLYDAAQMFFNGKYSSWIPFWGWVKGFIGGALRGQLGTTLLFLALVLAGSAALIVLIYRIKADFYEDAMMRSEEVAELMNRMQENRNGLFGIRTKKFSDKTKRESLDRGYGANVYFFKTMHTRFRFAKFGVFTKTMLTDLFFGVAGALFLKLVVETKTFMPLALMFCVIVFFRSLGNPMNRDPKMDSFLLVPENTWKKLFYSMLGGTANCLLDTLPAVIVGALIMGADLFGALAYLPLIVSVDCYATCVNTFLNLSIPDSIGTQIKNVIQILFIYFGLLPDIAILAVGFAFDWPYAAAWLCGLVNLFLSAIFFTLAGASADPVGGRPVIRKLELDETQARRAVKEISWIGISLAVMALIAIFGQLGLIQVLNRIMPNWQDLPWMTWVLSFAPLYLVAVPLGLLMLKKVPSVKLPQKTMKRKFWFLLPCMALFLMYTGNFVAVLLNMVLTKRNASSALAELVMDQSVWLRLLFMVILAPLIEEFIFRKVLITRLKKYGEAAAVITSAIAFGLFHGNIAQAIYAALLGILLGYVYVRTGRLRYTVYVHMFVNFMGGIVAPYMMTKLAHALQGFGMFSDKVILKILLSPNVLLPLCWIVLLIFMYGTGLAAFFTEKRRAYFTGERIFGRKEIRKTYLNPGTISFLAVTLGMIVYSLGWIG